jgi:hypothetical protein
MIDPSEQEVVDDFVIVQAGEDDEAARRAILNTATQELRCIYRPRSKAFWCNTLHAEIFVAKKNDIVLGTVACKTNGEQCPNNATIVTRLTRAWIAEKDPAATNRNAS